VNVKSFPSHKADRTVLDCWSVSVALGQTPVYTAKPSIQV